MPGRRIPSQLMAYLGTCRPTRGLVEKVVEQCGLAKLMGNAGLTDYDPLVVILHLVTEEILARGKSLDDPKIRKAWLRIVRRIQDEDDLEHNAWIPCRYCDQAFKPLVGEKLLALYLKWHRSYSTEDLLAIHRCPACGGTIKAKSTKTYKGDMHTPAPGSVADDDDWRRRLLEYSEF